MAKHETVEMKGPAGLIVVRKESQAIYEKKGYKVHSAPAAAAKGSEAKAATVDLTKLSLPELRKLAEEKNISIPTGARTNDIIRLIDPTVKLD